MVEKEEKDRQTRGKTELTITPARCEGIRVVARQTQEPDPGGPKRWSRYGDVGSAAGHQRRPHWTVDAGGGITGEAVDDEPIGSVSHRRRRHSRITHHSVAFP